MIIWEVAMKLNYTGPEIKAALALKELSTIGIARDMDVSRRALDYFIKGQMSMRRGEEFLKKLQPELDEIHKINKKRFRNANQD